MSVNKGKKNTKSKDKRSNKIIGKDNSISKKKRKLLSPVYVLIIMCIIFLIIGISYAFFNYIRTGMKNELIVGKIYMHYNTSRTISITGVEPRSTLDANTYIGFTIDGLDEYKKKDIVYAIDLLHGDVPEGKSESNRIRDEFLRFTLTKSIDDSSEEVVIDNMGSPDIQNLRIYTERIYKNTTTETEHNYKLYVWISDEISVGNALDADYSLEEWNNLFASVKVRVIGDFEEKGTNKSVKVNFDANGGSVNIPYMYYEEGDTYENLPVPEREDYTFDGWYNGNTKVLSTDIVTGEESVIDLHAEWIEIAGVAKIGSHYYSTLQEAVNGAVNNTETTVVVIKNISEAVTVATSKNIILDLRNHQVKSVNNTPIITNNGTIKIINGTLDGESMTSAVLNNNSKGKVIVGNGGRLVATGTGQRGSIYNSGGIVEIQEGAYLSSAAGGTAGGRKLPRATINSFGGGSVTITGGTIIGINQQAISNEDSVLTIGVQDGNVNKTSPLIMGKNYGISVINTSKLYYYDGVIKGMSSGINDVNLITEKESGNNIITAEEEIDGKTYIAQHLGYGVTITFDPNGDGASVSEPTRNVESWTKVGTLPIPTRLGYEFTGWYTANGIKISSETIVNGNITYYAHWEVDVVAEIDGKEYSTFQDAVNDVPQDNTQTTINITKDMKENITTKSKQNIVLNLQNNTIENTNNNPIITNNGTIEIVGGTVSSSATNAAIDNNPGGKLIINNGRVIINSDRGAIYNSGGTVEIKGDSYLSSHASGKATSTTLDRATINNFNKGVVTIYSGTIVGVNQQAISNENATLTIGTKDGNISTSTPTIIGKNYGVVNTGTFNFYDGTIKGMTGAISGSISDQEVNSNIAEGTELIDSSNYKTKYLVLSP